MKARSKKTAHGKTHAKTHGKSKSTFDPNQFQKSPTGIQGLDEITGGGLPKGRPTLLCGTAGCGKTLFSMEFLVAGATKFDEPGVFLSFEETEADLTTNVASLHFDLKKLIAEKKLLIEHVFIERSELHETGEYDLEALFVRLGHAIDSIGAKRVVIDTLEVLFAGLGDSNLLRAEIRRLFRFLKEKKVTAIITAERGAGTLTRHGIEEYVSDCVILLDHRTTEQISTRRIRIVKYRGSVHGSDEYPFLIDRNGISVLPITSLSLNHPGTNKRIPSGIKELDTMLGGKGYIRGSSILVSGMAGTGKTSIAAAFVVEACGRGERCLYMSFQESPEQLIVNMRSIGIDLEPCRTSGMLEIISTRPSFFGLEMHLLELHRTIETFRPTIVVIDPLTSLTGQGNSFEIQSMLTRMIDLLKSKGITALFTALIESNPDDPENSQIGVSALADTWVVVRELENLGRKRIRGLYIVKSRGMSHSDQVQQLVLSGRGISLVPVDAGSEVAVVLPKRSPARTIVRKGTANGKRHDN